MSSDKRGDDAPIIDVRRIVKDFGGTAALRDLMTKHDFPSWSRKTIQKRMQRQTIELNRLLDLIVASRLEGREFAWMNYLTWSRMCPAPTPAYQKPQPLQQSR